MNMNRIRRQYVSRILLFFVLLFVVLKIDRAVPKRKDENIHRIKQEILEIDEIETKEQYKERLTSCFAPQCKTWSQFLRFIFKTTGCADAYVFGGKVAAPNIIDGHKLVCMDEVYKPKKGNCVVISVGINDDWTFDESMDDYGCKVYSLDPTIDKDVHVRGKNIHFYPIGLANSDRMQIIGNKQSNLLTYASFLTQFGLRNVVIDYIKIDIETMEVEVILNILQKDPQLLRYVKQLSLEIHPGFVLRDRQKIYNMIYKLSCIGFQLFYTDTNNCPPAVDMVSEVPDLPSCCYELVWLNQEFSTTKLIHTY